MRGLRWDFADISFHSRDPVYFRFTVRMFLASDNVGNGTGESGVVENSGVPGTPGISFLCDLELEIWVGLILPPLPLGQTKL